MSDDNGTKQARLMVRLPQELRDRIEAAALADRRVMSDWVRIALEEYLEYSAEESGRVE